MSRFGLNTSKNVFGINIEKKKKEKKIGVLRSQQQNEGDGD